MENINLTHHFLIAMPTMNDSIFSKTLTYICEHNDQGALGLVINRPTDLTLNDLLKQLGIESIKQSDNHLSILFGGPVQLDCGFILHQPVGQWESTLSVNNKVGLTTSPDILRAIANAEGPDQVLVSLGYAGWAPGQIEYELAQNSWLTVPATTNILFDLSFEKKLPAAMALLGIDFSNLSNESGHA